ncbi:oligosaccharide flippase family protein [Patescibacteria group bacterium]|nr:oligosaccharide flippase family protein [Patescibacteria group bacterium]
MEEFDIALIAKRSIKGISIYISRSLFIQLINFLTNFTLTILLSPAVFGVYFIVSSINQILSYFSDIGLAGALVQKRAKVELIELRTSFATQQVLVGTICLVMFILSSSIGKFYRLDRQGVWLFQSFIAAFFLSSLKTIPSVILERGIQFGKLAIVQAIETVVFSTTAIILAIKGFGISAFTVAVLTRSISGTIAIYLIAPWRIGLAFSKSALLELLSFGIPFQLNSILALVKDDLFILFLGKILPSYQLGYIGFAQKWAFTPLRLIMDNVIKVTFSSFARLQTDKENLKKAFEKSIFVIALFVFPMLAMILLLFPSLFHLVPKYAKWSPAFISLGFFVLNAFLASMLVPMTNLLNAVGKIRITLYFMVFWTAATWFMASVLVMVFGFNLFAIVSALINFSFIPIFLILKRSHLDFDLLNSIKLPLISTAIMGMLIFLLDHLLPVSFLFLFSLAILGAIIYFGLIFILGRDQLYQDLKMLRAGLINR